MNKVMEKNTSKKGDENEIVFTPDLNNNSTASASATKEEAKNIVKNIKSKSQSTTSNQTSQSSSSPSQSSQSTNQNISGNASNQENLDQSDNENSWDDNDYVQGDNENNYSLDLAILNELSQIAQMGMSTISYLANRISDQNMKKELVSIYSQYSNILLQVNQHFEKYGEIPDDASLGSKMMSWCGIKFSILKDRSNSHVAEMMIQGTQMGVIECQKLLNANLDVDESTVQMIKDLLDFQNQNIQKLNAYL